MSEAQNGGKHCPSTVQKRGCQGYKCHSHSDRRVLRGKCFGVVGIAFLSRPNVCEYIIIIIAVWSWITAQAAAHRRWFFADVRMEAI